MGEKLRYIHLPYRKGCIESNNVENIGIISANDIAP